MSITVEELQSKKRDLESRLTSCIEAEVNKFKQESGFSPTHVSVNMHEVGYIKGRMESVVTGVNVGLGLDS